MDPNLVQLADAYQTALGALQVSGDEGSGREVLNNLSDSAVGVEDAALTEVPDSGERFDHLKNQYVWPRSGEDNLTIAILYVNYQLLAG